MSGGLREAARGVILEWDEWEAQHGSRAYVGKRIDDLRAALASEADTRTATESRPRARLREARAAIRDATRQIHETNEVLAAKLPAILASEADTRETEHIIGPGFYRRMYGPAEAREGLRVALDEEWADFRRTADTREGLDVERLARAMERIALKLDRDLCAMATGDAARLLAAEYAALRPPDTKTAERHRPVFDNDVPTGFCECGRETHGPDTETAGEADDADV